MVIIVEGIDRVGKTTLCGILKEQLNGTIVKGIPYNNYETNEIKHKAFGDVLVNTANLLAALNTDKVLILDRFHLSHLVYGILNRGCLDDSSLVAEKLLSKIQSLIVLVRPTDIGMSSIEHGSDLTAHNALFEHYIHRSNLPIIVTDFNNFNNCIEYIKEEYCGSNCQDC